MNKLTRLSGTVNISFVYTIRDAMKKIENMYCSSTNGALVIENIGLKLREFKFYAGEVRLTVITNNRETIVQIDSSSHIITQFIYPIKKNFIAIACWLKIEVDNRSTHFFPVGIGCDIWLPDDRK